jgi:hypothetical protein
MPRKSVTVALQRLKGAGPASERAHITPWHSVFKFHLLTDAEITFVSHNGDRKSFQYLCAKDHDDCLPSSALAPQPQIKALGWKLQLKLIRC